MLTLDDQILLSDALLLAYAHISGDHTDRLTDIPLRDREVIVAIHGAVEKAREVRKANRVPK